MCLGAGGTKDHYRYLFVHIYCTLELQCTVPLVMTIKLYYVVPDKGQGYVRFRLIIFIGFKASDNRRMRFIILRADVIIE